MEIITKVTTESTNDDIVALARKGCPHLTTVVAEFQTKGRGRRGNSWVAPQGSNLLFSTLIRSTSDHSLWSRIPQIAGMELTRAVEKEFLPNPEIKMKWPNDLYFRDKKWAGILVESKYGNDPFAVLGMGVNCLGKSNDYPENLRHSITTLREIFDTESIELHKLLKTFLVQFEESLEHHLQNFQPVVKFANQRDYLSGKNITVEDHRQNITGMASGIGNNGELLVTDSAGVIHSVLGGSILKIE